MQLRDGPQVLEGVVLHHRGVQVGGAVAESVAALVSRLCPLDLPVVVPHFESRRALRPLLVAAAIRVQRAVAAAGLVPLLVLVDGHQALGFGLFSAVTPGKFSGPVTRRRMTTGPSVGAVLPPLLAHRVAAAAAA